MITPRPHHHHLTPCCFLCILVCAIQHCHCFSCAQHSAPTAAAAGRLLCACGTSALYAQYYSSSSRQATTRMWNIRAVRSVLGFVVVVIGIGICTYLPQCVIGIFCSGPIIPGSIFSLTRVQRKQIARTSVVYSSVRTEHTYSSSDCCVSYAADR